MNDILFSYSREAAIADGVLIDVSALAEEAGVKYPTAMTAAVFAECVRVPDGVEGQDEDGRLWNVLTMFRLAARASKSSSTIRFSVLVRNANNRAPQPVELKAVCGPGDDVSPVITIMLPNED
ncbi:MAG TPA: DUF6573 family protein [Pirellulales bacterium]|jgi:hypothetical protein|nr:DUF6573 family protein [Pirellulales bacterium]